MHYHMIYLIYCESHLKPDGRDQQVSAEYFYDFSSSQIPSDRFTLLFSLIVLTLPMLCIFN